jgi:hypothetical protein
MELGITQKKILLSNFNLRGTLETIQKTVITNKLKVKGESLIRNRVSRHSTFVHLNICIIFDDKSRRMFEMLNWNRTFTNI